MFPIQNFKHLRMLRICAQVGSFTEAANVLGCTQSAVSQTVKLVESRLGFPLFQRTGSGIRLTPSGARFLRTIETSWAQIEKSAMVERRSSSLTTVRICAPPSFMLSWLAPRLSALHAARPALFVELETKENLSNVDESDADLVISYWNYDRPPLLRDQLFPTCSPGFAARHGLRAGMAPDALTARLADLPLIGESLFPMSTRIDAWSYWAQRFRFDIDNAFIRRNSLSHISLMEATLGAGVAMARTTLVAQEIADGRLLPLCDPPIDCPYHFFLEQKTASREADAVADWLAGEAAAHTANARPGSRAAFSAAPPARPERSRTA